MRVAAVNSRFGADETVRSIPESLDAIFALLGKPTRAPISIATQRARLPACPCGRNCALASYHAAEQALIEAVQQLQSELPAAARRNSDLAETMLAVRRLGRAAVDVHCEHCAYRAEDPRCRFLSRET